MNRKPLEGADPEMALSGRALMTGGSIPGLSRAAFSLRHSPGGAIPVLIAAPHAGRAYPPALSDAIRGGIAGEPGRAAMRRLEDRFVDAVALEVAALCPVSVLIAHAPRAMIDLNRAPNDFDLTMFTGSPEDKAAMRRAMPTGAVASSRALRGLGLFPRRLPGIGELWRGPMRPDDANRRIAAIHAPYHETLAATLADIREVWGEALLLDLHSMPDLSPRAIGSPPATHVIGDRFGASCRREIVGRALGELENSGIVCAYNRPYAGGYVLDRHGDPRRGVHAIQLELARSLYLDAECDAPGDGVAEQAKLVASLVQALVETLASGTRDIPQAAE